ncbi:MAG: LysM peptidoglycan-binding domain-containing protein [Lachnospiraceae bacterium]|nr:LysM peptidoglycan-binding domain-containing protein [Lachnospiraceae bacterium]MBR4605139.1 LysM peptidoglycan-binding domain-containing protein [Lachnospiraceae bacterium]MBR6152655.1 LysM peptidoglycan-binding domain-containing protein [Lachnospiraceae bacterium]
MEYHGEPFFILEARNTLQDDPQIARRFNTTVAWLVKVNLIKNPNLIWANQILKY